MSLLRQAGRALNGHAVLPMPATLRFVAPPRVITEPAYHPPLLPLTQPKIATAPTVPAPPSVLPAGNPEWAPFADTRPAAPNAYARVDKIRGFPEMIELERLGGQAPEWERAENREGKVLVSPDLLPPRLRSVGVLLTRGETVSLLSKIGRAVGGAALNLIPGGSLVRAGVGAVASSLAGRGSTAMPQLTMPAGLGGAIGRVGGTIGRTAGRVGVSGLIGAGLGLAAGAGNGCGCNGKGDRDPCTRQKLSGQRAPEATFFGGCCPPGRVLRRTAWGRDICAKQAHLNPFNPRALARADRRITSFVRRSTPILRDMGFQVSRTRRVALKKGRKRARR